MQSFDDYSLFTYKRGDVTLLAYVNDIIFARNDVDACKEFNAY